MTKDVQHRDEVTPLNQLSQWTTCETKQQIWTEFCLPYVIQITTVLLFSRLKKREHFLTALMLILFLEKIISALSLTVFWLSQWLILIHLYSMQKLIFASHTSFVDKHIFVAYLDLSDIYNCTFKLVFCKFPATLFGQQAKMNQNLESCEHIQ